MAMGSWLWLCLATVRGHGLQLSLRGRGVRCGAGTWAMTVRSMAVRAMRHGLAAGGGRDYVRQ